MTERETGPRKEARTRIPYTNPPLVLMLDGEQAITGRGVISRLPDAGPADEMLSRLADRLGADPLVLIAPGKHAWEYLTTDAKAWKVTGGPAWFTASRDDQRVRLCLLGYADPMNDPMIDANHRLTLVRHQRYALLTGVNFYADGGATSGVLMEATVNVKGAPPLRAWRAGPRIQEASWLGPWGKAVANCHSVQLDKNAYYLCAANSALLPLDGLTYMEGRPMPNRIGLYHLRVPGNPDERLPHPVGANAKPGAWQWVAQPTVDLLRQLGTIVEIDESWTCPRDRTRRVLVPWYERLRDARNAILTNPDPDSAAIRRALKDTYSRGIGCLDRDTRRWHRPDWRAICYAQARTCMYRALAKAGAEEDRWPAETRTDMVVYEGEAPASFKVGSGMGEWKATVL